MGEVILKIKLMPKSIKDDLDAMLAAAKKVCKVERHEINPIAFGLKALVIYTIIPDEGGTDEIEGKLSKIPHVQSVEVIDVRRAL